MTNIKNNVCEESTPKKPFEVTREGYSIYYHKGIDRREAEKLSKEFDHKGCDDAKRLGVFETLEQAREFAEAAAKKEDLSIRDNEAIKSYHYITFTLIRVTENYFTDNGALCSCDGWNDYGATSDELVDAMCPPHDDDEDDDEEEE